MSNTRKESLLYIIRIQVVDEVLKRYRGDRAKAAKFLGITDRALRYIISGDEYLFGKYERGKTWEKKAVLKDILKMLRSNLDVKKTKYYEFLDEEEKEFADKIVRQFVSRGIRSSC